MANSLNPLQMGLVLAGQLIGIIKDLTKETNVVDKSTIMEIGVATNENPRDLIPNAQVDPTFLTTTRGQDEIEIRGLRETLDEILADAKPSFV